MLRLSTHGTARHGRLRSAIAGQETSLMATVAEVPRTQMLAPRAPAGAIARVKPAKTWLFGPWIDVVFLANLTWPAIVLVALAGGYVSSWTGSPVVQTVTFWQLYFLSTPHRWITLGLVFLDEDRFRQRPATFMGLAIFFILFVTAVVLGTGATLVLVAIDYFWNAWHFAAQHSGISRIYGRMARPEEQTRGWWEKVLLRTFILYAIFRVGAVACGPTCGHTVEAAEAAVARSLSPFVFGLDQAALIDALGACTRFAEIWLDLLMLLLPFSLLMGELMRYRPSALGRLLYLGSVCAGYTALLLSIHYHQQLLTLSIALALSLFHATEYLAVVSWSVKMKHGRSRQGFFGHLVPRWVLALSTFMIVLALSGWLLDTRYHNLWAVVTIAVSYLHYAYDGIIWKVRKAPAAS